MMIALPPLPTIFIPISEERRLDAVVYRAHSLGPNSRT